MAVYRNFDEVRSVIDNHLLELYNHKVVGVPLLVDLQFLIYLTKSTREIEYVSIVYYALKDLLSVWFSATYEVKEFFDDYVELIEKRFYYHDPSPENNTIVKLSMKRYDFLGPALEIDDSDGNTHLVLEALETRKTKLEVYENGKIDESGDTGSNSLMIQKELDSLFDKRDIEMQKKTFEDCIFWIQSNISPIKNVIPASEYLRNTKIDEETTIPLGSENKIKKKNSRLEKFNKYKNKVLLDIWAPGEDHYNKIIEFLKKTYRHSESSLVIEIRSGSLTWHGTGLELAGFWKTCLDARFITERLESKIISQILNNTFSFKADPQYFEPAALGRDLDAVKHMNLFAGIKRIS